MLASLDSLLSKHKPRFLAEMGRTVNNEHVFKVLQKLQTLAFTENKSKTGWQPSGPLVPTRCGLICSVIFLFIFFVLVLFAFAVIFDGYNMFCITFFESKAFKDELKAKNETCLGYLEPRGW